MNRLEGGVMAMSFTRRQAITAGASAVAAGALMMAATTSASISADQAPQWLTLLGGSEQGGRDETPRVEGQVPASLAGSLYRNGPGLFERGGVPKPNLLDGDGLVQRLSFRDGSVRYQNRFVRTRKLAEEE